AAGGGARGGEPSRPQSTEREERSTHARARRQTVIHQDQDLADDVRWGTVFPVGAFAPLQLAAFLGRDALDGLRRDAEGAHDVLVERDDTATGDRAHGEFLVTGDA